MENDIQKHYDELRQAVADAKYWLSQYEAQLKTENEAKVTEIEAEYTRRVEEVKQKFEVETSDIRERVSKALQRLKYTAAPWEMEAWLGFPEESPEDAIKTSLRAGVIHREFSAFGINEVPLMLPMIDEGHVLVVSQGEGKAQGRMLLQSLVLRALVMLIKDDIEFIFIDPLGMGANFPFQSLPTSIRGEIFHVEEDEIDIQLRRLTDQIRKGDSEKRYILCVADFPRRFTEDALQRIISIAQQGVRSNIYAIMHVDSDMALPDGYDPSVLLEASSSVFITNEGATASINNTKYTFISDATPKQPLMNALLKKIGGV